jgi:hypothetical protein
MEKQQCMYWMELTTEGNSYGSKQLMIAKDTKLCEFDMSETERFIFSVVNLLMKSVLYSGTL